ncbi:MAG: hypothetical protein P8J37_10535 [Fuerstiella sp.]|nr:hypothetical protein [Fuerstiella sp.]
MRLYTAVASGINVWNIEVSITRKTVSLPVGIPIEDSHDGCSHSMATTAWKTPSLHRCAVPVILHDHAFLTGPMAGNYLYQSSGDMFRITLPW